MFPFYVRLICQFLELNTPACYSYQTLFLKSSENVDNQSYYIVRCSLTATTRPRQKMQKKYYILIEREKKYDL